MRGTERTASRLNLLGVREIALLLLVASAACAFAEGEPVSKYSSTAREKSASFREDKSEPGGGFEGVFSGFGGYQLIHLAGDDRSWINLRHGKKTTDLYAAKKIANLRLCMIEVAAVKNG